VGRPAVSKHLRVLSNDASVVAGLLAVTVRPWQVMLAAQPG
jgi:hypothetical protein